MIQNRCYPVLNHAGIRLLSSGAVCAALLSVAVLSGKWSLEAGIRRRLEEIANETASGVVEIGSVTYVPLRRAILRSVRYVSPPGSEAAVALDVERVVIELDGFPWSGSRLPVRSIRLDRPVLRIPARLVPGCGLDETAGPEGDEVAVGVEAAADWMRQMRFRRLEVREGMLALEPGDPGGGEVAVWEGLGLEMDLVAPSVYRFTAGDGPRGGLTSAGTLRLEDGHLDVERLSIAADFERAGRAGERVLEGLLGVTRLSGRAGGRLSLGFGAAGLELSAFELELEQIGVRPPGFPLPFTAATGRVELRGDVLFLERFEAEYGDDEVRIDRARLQLDLAAGRLRCDGIDARLRFAGAAGGPYPEALQPVLRLLSPRGPFRVRGHADMPARRDGSAAAYELTVLAAGAGSSLDLLHPDLEVTLVEGSARVTPEAVDLTGDYGAEFPGARGRIHGGRIDFQGRFALEPPLEFSGRFAVGGADAGAIAGRWVPLYGSFAAGYEAHVAAEVWGTLPGATAPCTAGGTDGRLECAAPGFVPVLGQALAGRVDHLPAAELARAPGELALDLEAVVLPRAASWFPAVTLRARGAVQFDGRIEFSVAVRPFTRARVPGSTALDRFRSPLARAELDEPGTTWRARVTNTLDAPVFSSEPPADPARAAGPCPQDPKTAARARPPARSTSGVPVATGSR